MSNSVTNVEIEDVLSSIRRLVSDDAAPKRAPDAQSEDDHAQQMGRLVLTPAQRVMESEPQAQEAAPEPEQPDTQPILLTEAFKPSEESHDETHAEEHDQDDHAEQPEDAAETSVISDIIQEELAAALGEIEAQREADSGDQSDDYQDSAESDEWYEDDSEAEAAEVLFEDVAEDVAVEEAAEEAVSEPTDTEVWEDEEDVGEISIDDVLNALPTHEEPEAEQPEHAEETERAQSLEDKIAELEAMVSSRESEWATDIEDEGENAAYDRQFGEALPWEDASFSSRPMAAFENASVEEAAAMSAEPLTTEEPVAEDTADYVEAADTDADTGAYIDEEMLRGMVTEIVRQELQGKLGERITRSVRKLVRQEIHRALMSQEFE